MHGTDPGNADSDGDSLSDGQEIISTGADPNNPDTDGDGFSDSQEIFVGTDPSGACGADKWPVDTNNDQIITAFDVVPFVPVLNTTCSP